MDLKKFEASSMSEAVKLVKEEFGKDAVILKSEEKNIPGMPRKFEITAARSGASAYQDHHSHDPEALIEIAQQINVFQNKIDMMRSDMATKDMLLGLDHRIDDIRHIVFKFIEEQRGLGEVSQNQYISSIIQYLELMDVNPVVLKKLAEYLEGVPSPVRLVEDIEEYFRIYAMKWLMKRLQVAPLVDDDQDICVNVFCGVAGSGKSSMCLKTAYYIKKKVGTKAVIVSYGSDRVGNSEAMRVYCKVLDIEFKSIDSVRELESLITQQPKGTHILIDTIGVHPKKLIQYPWVDDLKSSSCKPKFNLVLNLTEKSSQLEGVIKRFSPVGLTALCFTKMDESWSYGDILNLTYQWGLPLLSFGIGSKVPEDFEKATRERVIERIFGIRGGNEKKQ